jgi:hypothetical protein
MFKGLRLAAAASLAMAIVTMGAASAGAAAAHPASLTFCTGSLAHPGVLAGIYPGNVVVVGACEVNGGAAVIRKNLILADHSVLNATFALNDVAHAGTSSLAVGGDVWVKKGAALFMGCEPNFSPCSDDPNAGTGGTLTGKNEVFGSIRAAAALSLILHADKIHGGVFVDGGGGGVTCSTPSSGIFSVLGSPVFSDAEDNLIGGFLKITKLRTCWMGALRNTVGGSLITIRNSFADPDANEVVDNLIRGVIVCLGNSPATQYGDSMSSPNRVAGDAFGECGFDVRQPDPSPSGPLTPISVRI